MKEESEGEPNGAEGAPAPLLGLAGVEEDPGEQHIVRGID